MDGVLSVLKPPGMTSHDVVDYVRKCLDTRRVGHTGTLDPGAAGVLVLCVGQATRLSEFIVGHDKTYRAEALLGIETDTLDAQGQVTGRAEGVDVSRDQVVEGLAELVGEHEMAPPMYSAVRHKGRHLYELAREGREVERRARPVTVREIRLVRIVPGRYPRVLFDVCCSAGTYVRSLCARLGEALGSGAHLSFLLRTSVGDFAVRDALSLEQISARGPGGAADLLHPPEAALGHMPSVVVDAQLAARLACGTPVTLAEGVADDDEAQTGAATVRVHGPAGELLCIAEHRGCGTESLLQPRKVFAAADSRASGA